MGVFAVLATETENRYGGTYTLLKSTCAETLLAFFKAPIKMVGHSFFVFSILSGQSLEWKSPPREASRLNWRDTWAAFQSVSLLSLAFVVFAVLVMPAALPWCAMVAIPLILATPFVVLTGDAHRGLTAKQRGWLRTPEEVRVPRVLRQAHAFAQA